MGGLKYFWRMDFLIGTTIARGLLRLFVASALASVLALPVRADVFVECVQRQLAALEYDPGPIDGIFGKKTARALDLLQQEQGHRFLPKLQDLPTLSRATAIHWCRELPLIDSRIAEFRPSAQPLKLLANSEMAEAGIQKAYASVKTYMRRVHGVVLAGNIGIAAGDDWKTLRTHAVQIEAEITTARSKFHSAIRMRCDGKYAYYGAAFPDWMYFCWRPYDGTDAEWYAQAFTWLGRLMAHEYMHIVQAELSGTRTSARDVKTQNRLMGPLWMVEGAAKVIEAQYADIHFGIDQPALFQLRNWSLRAKRDLRDLRYSEAVMSTEEYALSQLAVRILADEKGHHVLFDFWPRLGKGRSWQQAFRETFGVELEEYELRVMELTKRPWDTLNIPSSGSYWEAFMAINAQPEILESAINMGSFSDRVKTPGAVRLKNLPRIDKKEIVKQLMGPQRNLRKVGD